jgi:hypothetical protein
MCTLISDTYLIIYVVVVVVVVVDIVMGSVRKRRETKKRGWVCLAACDMSLHNKIITIVDGTDLKK